MSSRFPDVRRTAKLTFPRSNDAATSAPRERGGMRRESPGVDEIKENGNDTNKEGLTERKSWRSSEDERRDGSSRSSRRDL